MKLDRLVSNWTEQQVAVVYAILTSDPVANGAAR
jgi:hypothetical protein